MKRSSTVRQLVVWSRFHVVTYSISSIGGFLVQHVVQQIKASEVLALVFMYVLQPGKR